MASATYAIDRVGRSQITGPDQFDSMCVRALRRWQGLPGIVAGIFHDPNLAYTPEAAAAHSGPPALGRGA
ncbi:hypothetical protein GCM10009700_18080 [Brevibacterium sanguinis]